MSLLRGLRRPSWRQTPKRYTPLEADPLNADPPKADHLEAEPHPCGQTDASENVTFLAVGNKVIAGSYSNGVLFCMS